MFRNQFDVLAVSMSYDSILVDLNSIGNECTCHNCALAYFHTRHQYTVNDLGTCTNSGPCEQYGILDLSV